MGIWTTAVLLYGIPVPASHDCAAYGDDELLDSILRHHPGVGHASAGPYDRDIRYICTDHYDAEISRHYASSAIVIAPFDKAETAERNARLEHAAMELDLGPHPEPSWYLIADQG